MVPVFPDILASMPDNGVKQTANKPGTGLSPFVNPRLQTNGMLCVSKGLRDLIDGEAVTEGRLSRDRLVYGEKIPHS